MPTRNKRAKEAVAPGTAKASTAKAGAGRLLRTEQERCNCDPDCQQPGEGLFIPLGHGIEAYFG